MHAVLEQGKRIFSFGDATYEDRDNYIALLELAVQEGEFVLVPWPTMKGKMALERLYQSYHPDYLARPPRLLDADKNPSLEGVSESDMVNSLCEYLDLVPSHGEAIGTIIQNYPAWENKTNAMKLRKVLAKVVREARDEGVDH